MGEQAVGAGLGNWIPDANRWNLPAPPDWFLKRLFDFDAQLVLIPSRKKVKKERPAYLLCRRRVYSAGLGDVAMMDNQHPDTNMCIAHSVVPIAPLRFKSATTGFTETGCTALLEELKSRDTWAISGGHDGDADKLWKHLEYQEKRTAQKERRSMKDMFRHMARDAYRSLKARTGQRNKRASDFHGHAVTPKPQSEQRVILTDAQ